MQVFWCSLRSFPAEDLLKFGFYTMVNLRNCFTHTDHTQFIGAYNCRLDSFELRECSLDSSVDEVQ